jgi:hypothetical protein
MDLQDLLAPVAGEFDVVEALEAWRWLVPEGVRAFVVTALGDLFMIGADGSVLFLDTVAGKCEHAASSVPEWERALTDAERVDRWFMPGLIEQLRDAMPLCQGECYSPVHSPALGGAYTVDNWRPTHWRVHFSFSGSMHEAIKDLPDGTVITGLRRLRARTEREGRR